MERRERFARTILNGFDSYFAEFQNITLAAKSRFENADWHGMQLASTEVTRELRLLVDSVDQEMSARAAHLSPQQKQQADEQHLPEVKIKPLRGGRRPVAPEEPDRDRGILSYLPYIRRCPRCRIVPVIALDNGLSLQLCRDA